MLRIFDFNMDGVIVRLASMSWGQAEKFVEEGKALTARGDEVKADEWLERTLKTVSSAMRGDDPLHQPNLSPEELKEQFDMPTINAMYLFVLEKSGLRTAAGEVQAAPAHSPSSAAA